VEASKPTACLSINRRTTTVGGGKKGRRMRSNNQGCRRPERTEREVGVGFDCEAIKISRKGAMVLDNGLNKFWGGKMRTELPTGLNSHTKGPREGINEGSWGERETDAETSTTKPLRTISKRKRVAGVQGRKVDSRVLNTMRCRAQEEVLLDGKKAHASATRTWRCQRKEQIGHCLVKRDVTTFHATKDRKERLCRNEQAQTRKFLAQGQKNRRRIVNQDGDSRNCKVRSHCKTGVVSFQGRSERRDEAWSGRRGGGDRA